MEKRNASLSPDGDKQYYKQGQENWQTLRSPGGKITRAVRFDYDKMEERMSQQSPGPMTGMAKSYIKGTLQLPQIKNTYKLLDQNINASPSIETLNSKLAQSNMASRTSLFSHKVTSPKESRNRFTENSKKFFPMLDAENYGIHSPNKIYDLT